MISAALLNFSFCSCIVFLILFNCPSVFSFSSPSILKTAILNYLLSKSQLFLWGCLLENYCVFWVVSKFPWFFMFAEILHCCLCIWRLCNLLQSFLTSFEREMPSLSALPTILRLSQTLSICKPAPHFLHSPIKEFLGLYTFSRSRKAKLSADCLPSAFPKAVLSAQVCGFSQACSLGLVFWSRLLASARLHSHCVRGMHREPVTGWGVVWMRHAGCCGPVVGLCRWGITSSLWAGFLMKFTRQLVESVSLWCPLKHYLLLSLFLPIPQLDSSWLSNLDGMRKKWVTLTVIHTASEARHSLSSSHFPPWDKSQAKVSDGTELCHLGAGVTQVKWNCSSYPL